MEFKDYLGSENARNKHHAALYLDLMQTALGDGYQVNIGHHLSFHPQGDFENENEIPSADTLIFDHVLMGRVFGQHAKEVMIQCVAVPCEERDDVLRNALMALRAGALGVGTNGSAQPSNGAPAVEVPHPRDPLTADPNFGVLEDYAPLAGADNVQGC